MKLRVLVSKCEVTEFTRLGKAVMTTILQMTMDVALLVQKNKDGIEPILQVHQVHALRFVEMVMLQVPKHVMTVALMTLLIETLIVLIQFLDTTVLAEIMKLRVLEQRYEEMVFTHLVKVVMIAILQMMMDVVLLDLKSKDGTELILQVHQVIEQKSVVMVMLLEVKHETTVILLTHQTDQVIAQATLTVIIVLEVTIRQLALVLRFAKMESLLLEKNVTTTTVITMMDVTRLVWLKQDGIVQIQLVKLVHVVKFAVMAQLQVLKHEMMVILLTLQIDQVTVQEMLMVTIVLVVTIQHQALVLKFAKMEY